MNKIVAVAGILLAVSFTAASQRIVLGEFFTNYA
jgi:hypothetical protein